MSIKVRDTTGTWRTVTQPWVRPAGVYKAATKAWTKVDGVWMESWPLQPGTVSGLIVTTTYRNDCIEIDVDWNAPTSGEPTAKYNITTKIGTGYTLLSTVVAPTTAMTLTNGGNGYHAYAGQAVTVTIVAQSTAGRNSAAVTSSAVTVAQLPAPPTPTSYTVSVNACAMHHTWAHSGGRRIDGVELATAVNGTAGPTQRYAANITSADYQSWNTSTIGGASISAMLRTYGPGGTSNWVLVTGTMPAPVTTSAYRFGAGYLRCNTSGISPAVQVHVIRNGGAWAYDVTFSAGATEVYSPSSINWARDRTYYGMILRPINTANNWTGRDQWMGWALKIPNPHYISANDSATLRNGTWRSEVDKDFQGSGQAGTNTAYFFYGTAFYDYLSAANVGYDIGITSAQIAMQRQVSGAVGAISPQLIVHRAVSAGGDLSTGGAYASSALARNQTAWVTVPTDWAWYLKENTDGWKGLGLYDANTQLLQGLGYVSANYSIFTAWNYSTIDGGAFYLDTVRIYHNG
jgi:hypothetical protein